MRCTVIQLFERESVGLCPFRGLYVREFELAHSSYSGALACEARLRSTMVK